MSPEPSPADANRSNSRLLAPPVATMASQTTMTIEGDYSLFARLEKQREWVELCDATDPALTYLPESKRGQRMQALNFETIHQGIVR